MEFIQESAAVYYCLESDAKVIGYEHLEWLEQRVAESATGQARICLHGSPDDAVQQMVIGIKEGRYCRPHKHVDKEEFFQIIRGRMLIIIFDEQGKKTAEVTLDSETLGSLCYRLKKGLFHLAIPLSDVIFLEVTSGPFVRENLVWAEWSPDGTNEEECGNFIKRFV